MIDPKKQHWGGLYTANVVWLSQAMMYKENGLCWTSRSVWGDLAEVQEFHKTIADSSRERVIYGVPCYGAMARVLGERGWGQKCPRCTWDGDALYEKCKVCAGVAT